MYCIENKIAFFCIMEFSLSHKHTKKLRLPLSQNSPLLILLHLLWKENKNLNIFRDMERIRISWKMSKVKLISSSKNKIPQTSKTSCYMEMVSYEQLQVMYIAIGSTIYLCNPFDTHPMIWHSALFYIHWTFTLHWVEFKKNYTAKILLSLRLLNQWQG